MFRASVALVIVMLLASSILALSTLLPAPPILITKVYVVELNLSHSILPLSYIESLLPTHPMMYMELLSEENATEPWLGVSNISLTLMVVNATPTPSPVLISSTSISNSYGSVKWVIRLKYLYTWMYPTPLSYNASWYVLITANVSGLNYVLFLFKTGYETLSDVLGNLSTFGGYLLESNGFRYALWHRYIYMGKVYYVVPLPGAVTFYEWFGNSLSPSMRVTSLPPTLNLQPFPQYLTYFSTALSQYYNTTLIYSVQSGPSFRLGNLTNYGYLIFGIRDLAPLGPLTYYTPLILYSNGTLTNPACEPWYYGLEVVFNFMNPAYGNLVPVLMFNEASHASGMLIINGSLIVGGYLISYDFYNLTYVYVTPLNSVLSQGVPYSGCVVAIYDSRAYGLTQDYSLLRLSLLPRGIYLR